MLTSLQTLVGRLSPLVLPVLHWVTYVATWQDRSTSLAVCAAWCLLCLAPRLCLVYGPHAVVLMYMGYHYSEKIKNPKAKPTPPRVPPLPKMVRYISRILGHVHAFLDSLDTFIARLSWKVPNEQESIHLFQAILLSYGVWILLNAILPLGAIIMLGGIVLIAWHSEFGEIIREIVSNEWEKARGRNPEDKENKVKDAGSGAPLGVAAASAAVKKASLKATVPASAGSGPDTSSTDSAANSNPAAPTEPAHSVGTVSFGNFQATVSLNPYDESARAKENDLKKAEKEAQAAAAAAMKAQIEAERAEEAARAALVASELAAAVAYEEAAAAAAAQATTVEKLEEAAAEAAVPVEASSPPPAPAPATEEKEVADEAPKSVEETPAVVEQTKEFPKEETGTVEESAMEPAEASATAVPIISVETAVSNLSTSPSDRRSVLADPQQPPAPSSPTSPAAALNDETSSIASSNAASNISNNDAAASLLATNRLQQKLAELAKKRLREAAAAKSAAAAAAQRAAERLAAVKAATPEPRFARGEDDDDDDDDDNDMGAGTLNLNTLNDAGPGGSDSGADPYLAVTSGSNAALRPISAAILAAATADASLRPPERTSSRVHSERMQQRALSPEFQYVPSPTPDPTTVSGLRQRRKEEAAAAAKNGDLSPTTRQFLREQQQQHQNRTYGSLRLSDDEEEETQTVILHDDNDSFVSGYSARTGSLPRSIAGSSVSAQWSAKAKAKASSSASFGGASASNHSSDPDTLLAGGLSQLGSMVDAGGHLTPTPGGLGKRSSVLTTTTNAEDYYDSEDEEEGSVLSRRLRQRRRSLESDVYTLDRHDGVAEPAYPHHDSHGHHGHRTGPGGSLPRSFAPPPNTRLQTVGAMQLPRPLKIPPVYNTADPFATRAEQIRAASAGHPASSHSTASTASSGPSYFSANVGSGGGVPMSPGGSFGGSALGGRAASSIMSRSSTRWENRKPLDVVLSFECYENQRWWVGLGWVPHLLPAERPQWTDFNGTRSTPKESFELLPFRREQLLSWKTEVPLDASKRYAWEWDGNWYVDVKGGGQIGEVDEEGWAYADNFWKDWKNRKTLKRVVRHRRWVRHARLFELGEKQSVKFSNESLDEEGSFDDAREEETAISQR
ncbi:peroxisome- protein [Phlyctochytrium bullatum]|nr:peroxisome- protein [Phlyctochytrium bullatum]